MPRHLMVLDVGTTSVRCILFGEDGSQESIVSLPVRQMYPEDGWVEQDPVEMWVSCRQVMVDAAASVEGSIVAIGITNQRETTIVWDGSGRPVYNAIVWQDRRTSSLCHDLVDRGHAEDIASRTGLKIDPYFSATKISWILDNVPGVRERAIQGELHFGTVDSWILWNLTDGRVHATDPSNASRTMLFDIRSLSWDPHLLEMFSVPSSMMPEIRPSSSDFGEVDESILGYPIHVMSVIGDQQAALAGQCCFRKGDLKVTLGTGGFMLMNIGSSPKLSSEGLLTTVAWTIDGRTEYAMEGSVYMAGAAVQWLAEGLNIIVDPGESSDLARSVDDTCGCYVVPAFTGLGAPYWDPDVRGTILGLTRATRREHIVRATLESIAFQVYDVMAAMSNGSAGGVDRIKLDGGAGANDFLCQFLSDVTGSEVLRSDYRESTARGAAVLASMSTGFWSQEVLMGVDYDSFMPARAADAVSGDIDRWHHAVDCARRWRV